MKAVIVAVLAGFGRAIVTLLTRLSERLTVFTSWSSPVSKTSGHVSGDALKPYIDSLGDYPLPNIWGTNDRR